MAFTNAHIIPVEGPEVQRGTLLVQNGKILAVGASVEVPKDALVQDCSNQVIMPVTLVDGAEPIDRDPFSRMPVSLTR